MEKQGVDRDISVLNGLFLALGRKWSLFPWTSAGWFLYVNSYFENYQSRRDHGSLKTDGLFIFRRQKAPCKAKPMRDMESTQLHNNLTNKRNVTLATQDVEALC